MEQQQALDCLMRIHYEHFMQNKRFWYDLDLREADAFIVVAASDLREEIRTGEPLPEARRYMLKLVREGR